MNTKRIIIFRMSIKSIEDFEYKESLKSAWGVKIESAKWFPKEVSDWIIYHSTILGVPETYISIPLLVSIAYCSQHSIVTAGEFHSEPIILYGLVCGRSGMTKSAALGKILNLFNKIENVNGESYIFDSGTLEGLMLFMK